MDGLTNNNAGYFQVNVPNRGALPGIVNRMGIQPIRAERLPPKIMLECILPDWLDMERELLAFKTGDRSIPLFDILNNHQTRDYDTALALLDDLMRMPEVVEVEEWEGMARIQDHLRYPMPSPAEDLRP